jgi:hypothetical protein
MTGMHPLYSLILIIALAPAAFGEVICSSDLSYKWTRKEGSDPESVYWKTFEARGAVEDDVKRGLGSVIDDYRSRALEMCKKEHENLSGCVSTKYTALANTLQQASFSARKSLEFAIAQDCQRQTGICGLVEAGEYKCITKEDPKPAQAEPAKADAKGDKKKK